MSSSRWSSERITRMFGRDGAAAVEWIQKTPARPTRQTMAANVSTTGLRKFIGAMVAPEIGMNFMDPNLSHDLTHLPDLLRKTLDVSVDYLESIESRPAATPVPAAGPLALPDDGLGAEAALDLFVERHGNAMPASNGPRFWGLVTGGTTPASLAGD